MIILDQEFFSPDIVMMNKVSSLCRKTQLFLQKVMTPKLRGDINDIDDIINLFVVSFLYVALYVERYRRHKEYFERINVMYIATVKIIV